MFCVSKIGNLKIHCIIEKITLPKVFFFLVEKKKSWHDHTMYVRADTDNFFGKPKGSKTQLWNFV